MATRNGAPADTTMMRIVHDALRRDLARARTTLAEPGRASKAQRRAVGVHLSWMMRFIHSHHASEDLGLYPLVRERAGADEDALEVLDRMTRAHEAIAPAAAVLETTATTLASDPSNDTTERTVAALDALTAVLLPHLREEEHEAMPIASQLITAEEWHAIEKRHNVDPKSMSDLGFEGRWLIDGATDTDRAHVVGIVPPIPRFVLLHGFARHYRRHATACWGQTRRAPRRVQMENGVAVTVDAGIGEVWEVVCDVTRVGEWSHECVGAAWVGASAAAVPGARFRGRNRAGMFRWGRVCEIVSAEPYDLVWRTVPTRLYPDSSEWRITVDEIDGGTRISQHFRVLRAPKALSFIYALMIPAHRDRTAALTDDLERLGRVAACAHGRTDAHRSA